MSKRHAIEPPCPCGRPLAYEACCGRYIDAGETAPDAETLMRSRYTAYTLSNTPYLLATWHPDTRPEALDLEQEPRPKWLGLEVKQHERQGETSATVEFVARHKISGRAQRMHEISRFRLENGRWFYLDGTQIG